MVSATIAFPDGRGPTKTLNLQAIDSNPLATPLPPHINLLLLKIWSSCLMKVLEDSLVKMQHLIPYGLLIMIGLRTKFAFIIYTIEHFASQYRVPLRACSLKFRRCRNSLKDLTVQYKLSTFMWAIEDKSFKWATSNNPFQTLSTWIY